jgi:hypothetical protein
MDAGMLPPLHVEHERFVDGRDEQGAPISNGGIAVLRTAVMLYHSGVHETFPKLWIDECIQSLLQQTFVDFDAFELDYGNSKA